MVDEALSHMKIHGFVFPPPIVNELAYNPSLLEKFKDVDFITTGGGMGPLKPKGYILTFTDHHNRSCPRGCRYTSRIRD